jgi:subtilisin-like proprotein convertase family protein
MRFRRQLRYLALLLSLATAAVAAPRPLPATARQDILLNGTDSAILLKGQSAAELMLHVEVGKLAALAVETPEGPFTRLVIPGFHATHQEGSPELPLMNRLIAIPDGARVRVEVTDSASRLIDLAAHGLPHPVMPSQPSLPKNADPTTAPFVIDRAAYQAERVGRDLACIVELGRMREMRLGRLELAPVVYLPATNQILVTETVDLRIVFEMDGVAEAAKLEERTPALYSPFFDHLFRRPLGGKAFQDDYPDLVRSVVTMAVITPPQFTAQLQDFLSWKTARGFHIVVGEVGSPEVGVTAASIRAFIGDLYLQATAERPAPSFVLLAGDVELVPTFFEDGNATDRPYGAVDGDMVPDIYYGRFPAADGTQLQAMLDKTLAYERFTLSDPSYLERVCLVAGVDGFWAETHANGQVNYGTATYFNLSHGIDSRAYLYPESGSSAAQIVQEVSDGVALVNYSAHGSTTAWSSPSFTQANVMQLSDGGRYCLAIGNCCSTGEFAAGECFAETWLRAPGKGAIGYIGGSNSTYWDEDFWWAVGACAPGDITAQPEAASTGLGAYDGVFHEQGQQMSSWYVTNAGIMFAGNLAVMEAGSTRSDYYWSIYNLMGDPSLATYLGIPAQNPVTHPAAVYTTQPSLTVGAAPGSYVGLTQAGALVGAGSVGPTGSLEVILAGAPLMPDSPLHLVVTGQNRRPYEADIQTLIPALVTIDPDTIDVNLAAQLTVTVRELDGVTPISGLAIWAEGLQYATEPVLTDGAGVAVFSVNYPYGPELEIAGMNPGAGYRLFSKSLTVRAAAMTAPDLWVGTDVGLSDAFAVDFPGRLRGTAAETGRTLYAICPDGSVLSGADTLVVTPDRAGSVTGIIAAPGYELYRESFPVLDARGTLSGQVTCQGMPLAGVRVRGHDGQGEELFTAVSGADGVFEAGPEIPIGNTTLIAEAFGYLTYEAVAFVRCGANTYDVELMSAPAGVLTGTVSDLQTAGPLAAAILIYRTDTMELFAETASDPANGSFTTPPLPYFDYRLRVRAWHHIPLEIDIAIIEPSIEKHVLLEPTNGDLLLIDDSVLALKHPAKTAKGGAALLAAAYESAGAKAAADLAADLEAIGYAVTVEPANATDPAGWEDYDLLVVSCGDNTAPLAGADLRSALEDYVLGGGHLLIEGGEVGYDACSYPGYPSFAADVLHVSGWQHDRSGALTLAVAEHPLFNAPHPLAGPLPLTFAGYGDQDAMTAASDAQAIGGWSDYPTDGSIIVFDPNPAPEGGQIVFFAFNWSALEATVRGELLANAMIWLTTPEIGDCLVSGRVTRQGETDHGGILVRALPGGGTALTDSDGNYELTGLYAGPYRILAACEGWSVGVADVTLSAGQGLTGQNFVLQPTRVHELCVQSGLSIPDGAAAGVCDTLAVSESGDISAVEVYVDVTHTYIADLVITLTSPAGRVVTLHDRDGGGADILTGWYPLDLTPSAALEAFLGEGMQGDWILTVSDNAIYDTGTLVEWCVKITYARSLTTLDDPSLPSVVALQGNVPNPFNPVTTVLFELPRPQVVDLAVYDLVGRRVATLTSGQLPAGRHEAVWRGCDDGGRTVASGVYVCRLVAGSKALSHKMLLVR